MAYYAVRIRPWLMPSPISTFAMLCYVTLCYDAVLLTYLLLRNHVTKYTEFPSFVVFPFVVFIFSCLSFVVF